MQPHKKLGIGVGGACALGLILLLARTLPRNEAGPESRSKEEHSVVQNQNSSQIGAGRVVSLSSSGGEREKKSVSPSGLRRRNREVVQLCGSVLDEQNAPISQASVTASSVDMVVRAGGYARSSANGAFCFEKLSQGPYEFRVTHDDFEETTVSAEAGSQAHLEIRMKRRSKAILTGLVVDQGTIKPIEQFEVSCNKEIVVVKDAGRPGVFTMEGGQGTSFDLAIRAAGYSPHFSRRVTLPKGVPSVDREFRMIPGARLVGRVVRNEIGGDPVSGARLSIGLPDPTTTDSDIAAVTGNDGRFRLNDVPAGSQLLITQAEKSLPPVRKEVSTVAGAEVDVGDIVIGNTACAIEVKVVKIADTSPMKGVSVHLRPAKDIVPRGTTNDEGVFKFESLVNRNYAVFATELGVFQMVNLIPGETKRVILRVGDTALSGRVTEAGIGVPAALHFSQGGTGFMTERQAKCDENGTYRIDQLTPGRWRVEAYLGGRSRLEEYVEVPASNEEKRDFILPAGNIVGRVVDGGGAPVKQATVGVFVGKGTGAFERFKPPIMIEAKTDAEGRFTLKPVPAGRYKVRASKEDLGQAESQAVEVGTEGEAAPVELVLENAATGQIISVALNEKNGLPLAEAWCYLSDANGRISHSATRDHQGIIQIPDLKPGMYEVSVGAKGFSTDVKSVVVEAGKSSRVDSVLYEGGTLRLGVREASGSFLPLVPVLITPKDPSSLEGPVNAVTSAGGMYISSGLLPGEYSVTASPEGRSPLTSAFVLRPREYTDLLLTFE